MFHDIYFLCKSANKSKNPFQYLAAIFLKMAVSTLSKARMQTVTSLTSVIYIYVHVYDIKQNRPETEAKEKCFCFGVRCLYFFVIGTDHLLFRGGGGGSGFFQKNSLFPNKGEKIKCLHRS